MPTNAAVTGSAAVPARPYEYDVAVCWRIYPGISGRPIFDLKDKFEYVRLNAESFRAAIGGLKVKLWVLLDKCPPQYKKLLESSFTGFNMEIIELGGEGNGATFGRQIDILSRQTDAELVYFAEDDYLYLPGSLETAVRFIRKHPAVDFVTLYDHKDHYTMYLHRATKSYATAEGATWRSIASTCLTFLARRQSLVETAEVFRTYTRKNFDLSVWLALTKFRVFNPWAYYHEKIDGYFVRLSHRYAWKFSRDQILFGKRRLLVAPVPSLATHMESSGLAPNVDWEKTFSPRLAVPTNNEDGTA